MLRKQIKKKTGKNIEKLNVKHKMKLGNHIIEKSIEERNNKSFWKYIKSRRKDISEWPE